MHKLAEASRLVERRREVIRQRKRRIDAKERGDAGVFVKNAPGSQPPSNPRGFPAPMRNSFSCYS